MNMHNCLPSVIGNNASKVNKANKRSMQTDVVLGWAIFTNENVFWVILNMFHCFTATAEYLSSFQAHSYVNISK